MNLEFLLQKISAINKKYENIADVTGENFNIFRILKIESREVRMHSAFLAELLNPKGSHGQKDSFLKLFIQLFKIKGFENIDKIDADVKVEEVSEYGRIDIVIKPRQRREIVVENKIYASDQRMQLIRYKEKYPNCHLLYLTLNGTEPDISSIRNEETTQVLKKGDGYCILSYKEDVLNWLLECRKESANHPLLRETLTQYINLIKHLTHQTMNEQNKIEIVEAIVKNPDHIDAAEKIADSWTDVKLKIIDDLKIKILNDEYIKKTLKLIVEFDEDYTLGRKDSTFWFYKQGWNYCICFCFASDFDVFIFGLSNREQGRKSDSTLKELLSKRLLNTNIGKNLNYPGWLWVSNFDIWDDTPWKNVEREILNAIKEILNKMIKSLKGLSLD